MTSQVFVGFLDSLSALPREEETMDGGGGSDTTGGSQAEGSVNEQEVTDPEGDTLLGTSDRDRYIGGEGTDCLTGSLNQDTLYGGGERDTLLGEGSGDVEFFSLSILSIDDNSDVLGYEQMHNLTFHGAGVDGRLR